MSHFSRHRRTIKFSMVSCSWAIITLPTPFLRYIFLLLDSLHDYVRMYIFKAHLHSHVYCVIAKLLEHSILFLTNVQMFECFVHIYLCRDLCMIAFVFPHVPIAMCPNRVAPHRCRPPLLTGKPVLNLSNLSYGIDFLQLHGPFILNDHCH